MNLLAACAVAQIINKTDSWIKLDQTNYEFAQKRCKVFYPESPCMKRFVKKAERTYHIVCGGKDASKGRKDSFLKNPNVF